MTPLVAVGAVILLATTQLVTSSPNPLSDEFISFINSKQSAWKAGRNFPLDTPKAHIRRLMGSLPDDHFHTLPVKVHDADFIASLPESFDARDKWPGCPTLNDIRDQGSCGSCWAHGAVEAMTDRICTYSNGTKHFYFSVQDLLSCCNHCGSGCEGGNPSAAWDYWKEVGLVSGGSYNSNQGCIPYEVLPCEHYVSGERPSCHDDDFVDTPSCVQTCEADYNIEYDKDKHFGKHVYSIRDGEDHIKAELFMNGPVEASFIVFEDFLHYKSGVYSYTHGEFIYGHAVKILGWGVEGNKKYWLVANSWNSDWGDNGFFKFLRGTNHLGFEQYILAGEPAFD